MPRRILTTEQLYKDHKNQIMERANSFVATCGGNADDFISEGNMVFMKAVGIWDSKRGSFNTLLRKMLNNRFNSIIRERITRKESQLETMPETPVHITARDSFFGSDFVKGLSKEATHIVQLVLDGPREFWEELELVRGNAGHVRRRIALYLIKHGHKNHNKTWKAFHEIAEALKCS